MASDIVRSIRFWGWQIYLCWSVLYNVVSEYKWCKTLYMYNIFYINFKVTWECLPILFITLLLLISHHKYIDMIWASEIGRRSIWSRFTCKATYFCHIFGTYFCHIFYISWASEIDRGSNKCPTGTFCVRVCVCARACVCVAPKNLMKWTFLFVLKWKIDD